MAIRTEHAGAKNGGGFWGRRVVAKAFSRALRRSNGKAEVEVQLADMTPVCPCGACKPGNEAGCLIDEADRDDLAEYNKRALAHLG